MPRCSHTHQTGVRLVATIHFACRVFSLTATVSLLLPPVWVLVGHLTTLRSMTVPRHFCILMARFFAACMIPDLFEKLVPLPVYEALQMFENRKNTIVNMEIGRLREATALVNR